MRELLKSKLVWIAAFGYFVDLFDLVLYGAVRVESLTSMGVSPRDLFSVGAMLLNVQMAGMVIGGFAWGMLGDRRGRREALFGSILIYSLATFLNAYVKDVPMYAFMRFFAGFGLAGELGAAVTLVSEILPQKSRGMGSAWITSVGFLGAVASSYLSQNFGWQNGYRIGGVLGIMLLFARFQVRESHVYLKSREDNKSISWGSVIALFKNRELCKYYALALLAGVPIWYVAGILSYFAPEFALEMRIDGDVTAGYAIMVGYLGSIIGDLACGLTSQVLRSRKKAVMIFMVLGGSIAVVHPLLIREATASSFYWTRFWIGTGCGFFAMLIAWISEIFGTNLRATATTSLVNLIRASVIPITLLFQALAPNLGLMPTSISIGFVCFGIALLAASRLPETFHREINFTH
ncbi:MAG: MFS transporter [Bdellovibrionales bacterium]|nr:MFS transporter [Bdellovibrionales bacterium]